jgi:Reverse transcriptase (RNA-dependent DNA polymerase)
MVKNAYPLPLISEIMDKLKGAKYFSKFDIQWGYNNVWIRSGDEWKATFNTNQGLYEITVMFFGMCNSLATFQAMMDVIFKKKIEEDLIIVYMDNILAFSKMIDGLRKIEWIILEKASEYDLYFKAKKCEFRKLKLKYLGLVVEEGKLPMDPTKLKGILDWPAPKTVKEVRSFIGFGNFYCRFVKEFSHLAHPLHDLLKKDKKFVLSEECQEYFDQLKKQFTEEPVLMMLPLKVSLPKWILMETDTLVPTSPKAWWRNKGIMTLETENYWLLYRHWKSGDIIFKDLDIQRLSYLIMIIFNTSKFHKLLGNEWLDGLHICPNSILKWFIFQEKRTYKLTHYHGDQTYAHKEQTTKMSLYCRNICSSISLTWNYRRR